MDNFRIKIYINGKPCVISLNELSKSFFSNKLIIQSHIMKFLKPALFTNLIGLVSNVFSISEFRINFYEQTTAYTLILQYSDLEDIIFSCKPNLFPTWIKQPEQKENYVMSSIVRFLRIKSLTIEESTLLLECYNAILNFLIYLKEYSKISKKQRLVLQKRAATIYMKERENQLVTWNYLTKIWVLC